MLYALHQQAEEGTCNEPKPWSWNVVESAKWNSWNQLGDMAGVEAMRLYVKFLETEIKVDHLHTASVSRSHLARREYSLVGRSRRATQRGKSDREPMCIATAEFLRVALCGKATR